MPVVHAYSASAAISFVFAVNVLLSTVFISVFGMGLALRGPLGSMVRAIDGKSTIRRIALVIVAVVFVQFCVSVLFVQLV